MSLYTPDIWVIIKIYSPEHGTQYRVLAGWYGGYAGADSWKMNSGITGIKEFEDRYEFEGVSGSTYVCYKSIERLSGYTGSILSTFASNLEKLKDGSYVKQVEVSDIPLTPQKILT